MICNRSKFENILRLSCQRFTPESKRSLRRLSIMTLVICCAIYVKDIVAYSLHFSRDHAFAHWPIWLKACVIWNQKDCNIVLGRFIFCFFVRLVTLSQKESLRSIVNGVSCVTTGFVFVQSNQMLKFKKCVIEAFSFLPVLWWFREFVYFVVVIVSRRRHGHDILFFYFCKRLPFIVSLMTHAFMICYIDDCRKEVRVERQRLAVCLAKHDYKKWKSIIANLDNETSLEFTVCNLFNINKRSGLTFVSSLITLTVLFEQLLSSLPQR